MLVVGVRSQAFSKLSRWDATANGKLFLATGRFQPYAVVGVGYVGATGTCGPQGCVGGPRVGSFVARFGGGLDIFFAPRFGVYAEGAYMLAPSDIPTGGSFPDYWTFGAGGLIAF